MAGGRLPLRKSVILSAVGGGLFKAGAGVDVFGVVTCAGTAGLHKFAKNDLTVWYAPRVLSILIPRPSKITARQIIATLRIHRPPSFQVEVVAHPRVVA